MYHRARHLIIKSDHLQVVELEQISWLQLTNFFPDFVWLCWFFSSDERYTSTYTYVHISADITWDFRDSSCRFPSFPRPRRCTFIYNQMYADARWRIRVYDRRGILLGGFLSSSGIWRYPPCLASGVSIQKKISLITYSIPKNRSGAAFLFSKERRKETLQYTFYICISQNL